MLTRTLRNQPTKQPSKRNFIILSSSPVLPTISLDGLETTHNVIENRTAVLECPAKGAPAPSILWFYKGIPVESETDPDLTISDDGTQLRIASAQVSDAGVYVCIASNEAGDAQLDHTVNVWGKSVQCLVFTCSNVWGKSVQCLVFTCSNVWGKSVQCLVFTCSNVWGKSVQCLVFTCSNVWGKSVQCLVFTCSNVWGKFVQCLVFTCTNVWGKSVKTSSPSI